MKQIVVLSGKGGTGKTVVTGSLAALVPDKVIVDCDVDASDLHLLLQPKVLERHQFQSGKKARIQSSRCVRCGLCRRVCRFQAVDDNFAIDPASCEGCGLCAHLCPVSAIKMHDQVCGEWFVSSTRFGTMVHARLHPGEENSGKLVAHIRQKAKMIAEETASEWVIIDGPPGIGCPVMASMSQVSAVLLVTEPTFSGLHDASRVLDLAEQFKVPVFLLVNKWDLNPVMTADIEKHCVERGTRSLGRLMFTEVAVRAVANGRTIPEEDNLGLKQSLANMWDELKGELS